MIISSSPFVVVFCYNCARIQVYSNCEDSHPSKDLVDNVGKKGGSKIPISDKGLKGVEVFCAGRYW